MAVADWLAERCNGLLQLRQIDIDATFVDLSARGLQLVHQPRLQDQVRYQQAVSRERRLMAESGHRQRHPVYHQAISPTTLKATCAVARTPYLSHPTSPRMGR
jgi:hypothetical protein